MKPAIHFRYLFLIGLPFLLITACQPQSDSLDAIKKYQPDDKYFKSALISLHFIIETSPITKVDSTFSQLLQAYHLPVDAIGAANGVYEGESPYDAFDYKHVVKLTIKNEKIVALHYNEVHKNGTGKREDKAYNDEMSSTGTTPAEAYPHMEQALLHHQNMLEVDAISGATYSLYRFRYAVTVALMKAQLRQETK